jgi:hypothetical protein
MLHLIYKVFGVSVIQPTQTSAWKREKVCCDKITPFAASHSTTEAVHCGMKYYIKRELGPELSIAQPILVIFL